MNRTFYQVDVFTNVPFGGNPLAVVFDCDGLKDQDMQSIAREMNLSETTFVLPPGNIPVDFIVRIFTPEKELPFAGHPTLGTAHILRETGKLLSGNYRIKFSMKSGIVTVVEGENENLLFMDQLLPDFHQTLNCAEEIGTALGILTEDISLTDRPVQIVSTGLPVLLVPVVSLKVLENIKVNNTKLRQFLSQLDADLIYTFTSQTFDENATIHSRSFAPELGISEDPATGSAAGAAGAYLVKNKLISKEDSGQIFIEQGHMIGRPSSLFVSIMQNGEKISSVKVGGESVTIIKGVISI
jgi:trans-2,3-dihydro-3-hydroxyanthranilate isomerase